VFVQAWLSAFCAEGFNAFADKPVEGKLPIILVLVRGAKYISSIEKLKDLNESQTVTVLGPAWKGIWQWTYGRIISVRGRFPIRFGGLQRYYVGGYPRRKHF